MIRFRRAGFVARAAGILLFCRVMMRVIVIGVGAVVFFFGHNRLR
jgi:hypothetical protein